MIMLLRYLTPYIGLILTAVLLLFGQAACDLSLPDFMSDIVNQGITTGDSSYIIEVGIKMLGVSLIGATCSVTVGLLGSRVAAGVSKNMRNDVFERVESFSGEEFITFSTSSLITRTTNDITQIQTLIVMMIRMVFYAPVMGIGGFFHALAKSSSMSWIIGLAVVMLFGIIITMFSLVMPKFKKVQTLIDRLNLVVRENLEGMLVIRAFNTQRFEEERFDKVNKDLTGTNLFVNRVTAGMMPAMMLLMNLITVLVIWIGANQVAAFKMEVGDMMAYMQYVMQIIMAFLMMSMMFIMIPRAMVSAQRIEEVLVKDTSVKNPKNPVSMPEKTTGTVVFEHVGFMYPDGEENVLHDVSFTAKPGETTAIIGSTGSGKSALVSLIPRFYDVTEGRVTIDGVDIRDMELTELRRLLGFVPQKGVLFSGTIKSNISYADPEATDEQIAEAANIAQASDFIASKPDGMSTSIGQGGGNVSGGQKQRISIARALLAKPQIYIFDDSFSALDLKTDAALRASLREHTAGSTLILVAQRISTIMNAENIIVLDHGRICGIGTHRQLLENCEVYKEIALSQLREEELQ